MTKFIVNEMPKRPYCCPACAIGKYELPFCNIIDRACILDNQFGRCDILMTMEEYAKSKYNDSIQREIDRISSRYLMGLATKEEFNTLVNLTMESAYDNLKGE